jgi:transketolase
VQHCVAAQKVLAGEGVRARVISMPCIERFLRQDPDYRDAVLPPAVRARLAIEAAAPQSWYQLVGLDGVVIGMTRFGASAPYEELMEQFGFTSENVVRYARMLLEQAAARL